MALLSAFLRSWSTTNKDSSHSKGVMFFCPGCQHAHSVGIEGSGPIWTWNGDVEKPIFASSIRTYWPAHMRNGVLVPERTLCHSFVGHNGAQPGEIFFLDDCTEHSLRGAHPLPPWPSNYGGGEN